MKRLTLTALLLIAPGLAAQEMRSGPNAPATSAPGNANARTGAEDARTAPPADHPVLGGPPVPGAQRSGQSAGFAPRRDPIPSDIGQQNRPGASTTGRGR